MRIFVIPDAQVKPNTPTDHLRAAGNYIVAKQPDVVVNLGDFWDMESLSSFNSTKMAEGQRIREDIDAGKDAMDELMAPLVEYNANQRKNKKKIYKPRLVFTTGNHDAAVRIPRYIESHPSLEGLLNPDECTKFLQEYGYEVYDFLDIVTIGGINFSHYFQNPHSAKKAPLSGNIDSMLKNAGFSFVQGHTQGLKMGKHYLSNGEQRLGIVAGSFYQHDEGYMLSQGNKSHWRGCIMLNEVKDGGACITEISLDYLMKEYS